MQLELGLIIPRSKVSEDTLEWPANTNARVIQTRTKCFHNHVRMVNLFQKKLARIFYVKFHSSKTQGSIAEMHRLRMAQIHICFEPCPEKEQLRVRTWIPPNISDTWYHTSGKWPERQVPSAFLGLHSVDSRQASHRQWWCKKTKLWSCCNSYTKVQSSSLLLECFCKTALVFGFITK